MSALDGWIDICRAGTWRDMQGHDVRLDAGRLDRIVAAHAAADPAPVVVGHPEADAPAYAWVAALRRVGDRLQATLRDIAPSFREAVEAGRYSGRSIALQGDALRHVGFLGGRAPAVPGLAPTRFAAAPEAVIAFADDDAADTADAAPDDEAASPAEPHPSPSNPLRACGPTGDEDGDSLVPLSAPAARGGDGDGGCSHLPLSPSPEGGGGTQAAPADSPSPPPGGGEGRGEEGGDANSTLLAAREAELAAREARLAAREAEAAAEARLRRADDALAPYVEAGRVLPAERAGLAALLAALGADGGSGDADDTGRVIAFAAPEGGEERMPPAAVLERFLEGLPRRVDYRTLAGGALPAGPHTDRGEDSERIAAEARALIATEAEKGVTLTPAEAVDRARARRGLGTQGGKQ